MEYTIDTNIVIGVISNKDRLKEPAQKLLKNQKSKSTLVLSENVLTETVKTFSQKANQAEKKITSDQPNLQLRWRGVLQELKDMPDQSVKIVNADFLFTEFYVTGWKDIMPDAELNEFDEAALGWRAGGGFMAEFFKLCRQATVNQVKRVLTPNGRFYITEWEQNLPHTLEFLDEAGFQHESRPLTDEEMEKTWFLQEAKKKLATGELPPEATPVRIQATKKPEDRR